MDSYTNAAANGRMLMASLIAVGLFADLSPLSAAMIIIPALLSVGAAYVADSARIAAAHGVDGAFSLACFTAGAISTIAAVAALAIG